MSPIPPLRRLLPFLALAASLQLTLGYYDPAAQRWINRDPIGERGSVNTCAAFGNQPTGAFDTFGRAVQQRPPRHGPPMYVTPLPPAAGDPCDGETKRYAEHGLAKACEFINSACFADCMKDQNLVQSMRQVCAASSNIQIRCPGTGDDPECKAETCAYAMRFPNTIVVCPSQVSGEGCQTLSPECIMTHEIAHLAGVPGEGPASAAANEAEKCVPGCNSQGKHKGEP